MPVARDEDRHAGPLGGRRPIVEHRHDRVPVDDRERPTRAEVVLRIDQQQRIARLEQWRHEQWPSAIVRSLV
jgi:hypothetical protein